jgi:hypothetical protein
MSGGWRIINPYDLRQRIFHCLTRKDGDKDELVPYLTHMRTRNCRNFYVLLAIILTEFRQLAFAFRGVLDLFPSYRSVRMVTVNLEHSPLRNWSSWGRTLDFGVLAQLEHASDFPLGLRKESHKSLIYPHDVRKPARRAQHVFPPLKSSSSFAAIRRERFAVSETCVPPSTILAVVSFHVISCIVIVAHSERSREHERMQRIVGFEW